MAADTEKLRDLADEITSQHPLHAVMMADAADNLDDARAEVERLRALLSCEIERRATAEGRAKGYQDVAEMLRSDNAALRAEVERMRNMEPAARDEDSPMQTGITWTRYDGTPETLPDENRAEPTLISPHGSQHTVFGYRNGMTWELMTRTLAIRVGDWHAPWPAAPQGGE